MGIGPGPEHDKGRRGAWDKPPALRHDSSLRLEFVYKPLQGLGYKLAHTLSLVRGLKPRHHQPLDARPTLGCQRGGACENVLWRDVQRPPGAGVPVAC
jgi:hypothetical protein